MKSRHVDVCKSSHDWNEQRWRLIEKVFYNKCSCKFNCIKNTIKSAFHASSNEMLTYF